MSRDWVVFDVNSVVWRAYHGGARRDPAAAVAAFLLRVPETGQRLGGSDFAFAFDHGPYRRAKLHPGYKLTREDPDEAVARDEVRAEVRRLREKTLPQLGFGNVWSALGFEADDVIASCRDNLPPGDRMVIVSDDRDFYQLLSSRCAVYHPRAGRFYTANDFRREFGIKPVMWAEVKSLAGCATDDVPGMRGVGEKTAVKFFREEFRGTPKHDAIVAYNRTPGYALANRLVRLPFAGCPAFAPDPDPDPHGNVGRLFAHVEKAAADAHV